MLLGILGASSLRHMSVGTGVVGGGEGTIKAGEETIRAGETKIKGMQGF